MPGSTVEPREVVAALRHLDLDHLGAEIGHQHVGHRARLRGGAGDDLDALQADHAVQSCAVFPQGLTGWENSPSVAAVIR